ncbi:unnamed protein product [marine sediment metagenome]|uniref:Uncharacterized protein n=1 Tax=marine sediment metagenome TaxID=412755 RepID=X0U952_9ZZZZ
MGFDSKGFMNTKFQPREASVPVPDLKEFFEEGDKPEWKVRGLTGQELGRTNEAAERNRNIAAILEGLVAPGSHEKIESVRQLLGVGNETPQDIARRLEMLTVGSVEPPCDIELALKLCTVFPIEFYQITTKIVGLTGKGHMPGKAQPSGKTTKSE